MKIAKIISLIGAVLMTIGILNGFINGSFSEDGAEIMANPWGVVSLIDLYVGFILFSLWIIFREKQWVVMVVWVVLMMILGFLTASIYIYITLRKNESDWLGFFLGARKENLIESAKTTT